MRASAPYSEEGHCGAEVASGPAEQHPATRVFGRYCSVMQEPGQQRFSSIGELRGSLKNTFI